MYLVSCKLLGATSCFQEDVAWKQLQDDCRCAVRSVIKALLVAADERQDPSANHRWCDLLGCMTPEGVCELVAEHDIRVSELQLSTTVKSLQQQVGRAPPASCTCARTHMNGCRGP